MYIYSYVLSILVFYLESWQSKSIRELKMKIPSNKLYSTEHIELLSTIGQGIHDACVILLINTGTIFIHDYGYRGVRACVQGMCEDGGTNRCGCNKDRQK